MATLMTPTCTSCDDKACQGCVSCQKCNKTCQVTCNADNLQTLCNTTGQTYAAIAGSFSWKECATAGEIMGVGYFDKDEWDRIITHINKARNAGTKVSTGGAISKSTTANVSPFSAKEFNRVAQAVGNITVKITEDGKTVTKTNASQDDVIYGKYFTELKNAANKMLISSKACNSCNAACDGGCNACQKCNTKCVTCNSQTKTKSTPYCCACDKTESACSKNKENSSSGGSACSKNKEG